MVLVQKWPFFELFFLGNIGQENVFYDYSRTKKCLSTHLYCCIKHIHFDSKYYSIFCVFFSLGILFVISITLWDIVSKNVAQ